MDTVAGFADFMSESQWQKRITDYCDLLGVRWHHETDSRKSKAGFPDLVLVGPGGVAFLELKKAGGRLSQPQRDWLASLTAAGAMALCVRPGDWAQVKELIEDLARRWTRP